MPLWTLVMSKNSTEQHQGQRLAFLQSPGALLATEYVENTLLLGHFRIPPNKQASESGPATSHETHTVPHAPNPSQKASVTKTSGLSFQQGAGAGNKWCFV